MRPEEIKGPGGGARASGSSTRLTSLAGALKSRRVEERLGAVSRLEQMKDPEAAPLLLAALRDRQHFVAAVAARALGRIINPEITGGLIQHFSWVSESGIERDSGCHVRSEIVVALGNGEFHQAVEILCLGIRTHQVERVGLGIADTATGLRANCGLALAQLRPPGALLEIALLLFEPPPDPPVADDTLTVRRAAAKALGALGDPAGSVPLVLRLTLKEEVAEVKAACMDSLAALRDPRALSFIAPFLQGTDPFLVAASAAALGRLQDPAAIAILFDGFNRADAELAEVFASAIAGFRSEEARDGLLDRLDSSRSFVRAASARALGLFPDAEVRSRLLGLVEEDPHPSVQAAAAESLAAFPEEILQEEKP